MDKSSISRIVNVLINEKFVSVVKKGNTSRCLLPSPKLLDLLKNMDDISSEIFKKFKLKINNNELLELSGLINKLIS
jgi:hypothetical protein